MVISMSCGQVCSYQRVFPKLNEPQEKESTPQQPHHQSIVTMLISAHSLSGVVAVSSITVLIARMAIAVFCDVAWFFVFFLPLLLLLLLVLWLVVVRALLLLLLLLIIFGMIVIRGLRVIYFRCASGPLLEVPSPGVVLDLQGSYERKNHQVKEKKLRVHPAVNPSRSLAEVMQSKVRGGMRWGGGGGGVSLRHFLILRQPILIGGVFFIMITIMVVDFVLLVIIDDGHDDDECGVAAADGGDDDGLSIISIMKSSVLEQPSY